MKSTFSCVLCVLVVASCWAQIMALQVVNYEEQLLKQAMHLIKPLINSEKVNNMPFHSPTNDIEECCSQSALKCFSTEFTSIQSTNQQKRKLDRNLQKLAMLNSLNTCTPEEIKNVKCKSCKSYPKASYKQFLTNLQSHLQKTYSRLS